MQKNDYIVIIIKNKTAREGYVWVKKKKKKTSVHAKPQRLIYNMYLVKCISDQIYTKWRYYFILLSLS